MGSKESHRAHSAELMYDAAYKYTLWQKLWAEWQTQDQPREEGLKREGKRAGSMPTMTRFIERAAFPIIKQYLPHRLYEPCCLEGSCMRYAISSDGSLAALYHRYLHMGRKEILLLHGIRDEACFCLAHACAPLGDGIRLRLCNYNTKQNEMRNPYRGLQCLLTHPVLSAVEICDVYSRQDAVAILEALKRLFMSSHTSATRYTDQETISFEVNPASTSASPAAQADRISTPTDMGTFCQLLSLENWKLKLASSVPVPHPVTAPILESGAASNNLPNTTGTAATGRGLQGNFSSLLKTAALLDSLTQLRLCHCEGLVDLVAVAGYVRSSRRLRSLSLQGMKKAATAADWNELSYAVAANPGLLKLDLSECGWGDVELRDYLLCCLDRFQTRVSGGFFLDLSRNVLTAQCMHDLITLTPVCFRTELRCLRLAAVQSTELAEDVFEAFLEAFPGLSGLDVGHGCWRAQGLQRLLRALMEVCASGGSSPPRAWRFLDLSGLPLPLGLLKRLAKLRFQDTPSTFADEESPSTCAVGLVLSGVDLGRGMMFSKAALHTCFGALAVLDLSRCGLGDEGVALLAWCLEKAAAFAAGVAGGALPIRVLRLSECDLGCSKNKTEGALSLLCKVLRAGGAPRLMVLDLSQNRIIPSRPICAFIEQVSRSLRELVLSHTSLAENAQELGTLVTKVMRRQQHRRPAAHGSTLEYTSERSGASLTSEGFSAFEYLDLKVETPSGKRVTLTRELSAWLHTQTAVRLMQ